MNKLKNINFKKVFAGLVVYQMLVVFMVFLLLKSLVFLEALKAAYIITGVVCLMCLIVQWAMEALCE